MAARFRQQELECMPLPQIAAFQEEKLKQSRLISRAYDSALYRSSWQKAGFAPASIQNRADLRQVPYLTGGRSEGCLCHVRHQRYPDVAARQVLVLHLGHNRITQVDTLYRRGP